MRLGIAGAGAMGSWFASLARSEGWEVYLFDILPDRAEEVARRTGARAVGSLEELGERAEVLLVAVPISRTPEVLRRLGGKGELLMDLASVKAEVVRTLRRIGGPETASLHPLFGPGAGTLRGKVVISVPVRVGRRYREFLRFLSSRGARVVEMGAAEHDRLMAVMQALTHFVLLSCAGALEGERVREELSTPLFSSLLRLVKACLASDPSLCGEIQVLNPHSGRIRERVLRVMEGLHRELSSGRTEGLRRILEKGNRRWGEEVGRAYRWLYEELERSGSSP